MTKVDLYQSRCATRDSSDLILLIEVDLFSIQIYYLIR